MSTPKLHELDSKEPHTSFLKVKEKLEDLLLNFTIGMLHQLLFCILIHYRYPLSYSISAFVDFSTFRIRIRKFRFSFFEI